jgi:hypothetical protein
MGGELDHGLQEDGCVNQTIAASGAADFDFLLGDWNVRHCKLRHRLAGDQTWVEFGGTMTSRAILGGAGNFDENVLGAPEGAYEACTVRMFDARNGRWSIFWIDGRNPRPDPPVVGFFSDDEGRFFGDDMLEGRQILVRFLWSRIRGPSPRWEQAFSADRGASWETNWIMDFDRVTGGDEAPAP